MPHRWFFFHLDQLRCSIFCRSSAFCLPPGAEFSGVVEEVGEGVSKFTKGLLHIYRFQLLNSAQEVLYMEQQVLHLVATPSSSWLWKR